MRHKFIVFTDLDGTLLGHSDYRYSRALPALASLRAAGVPVVLNTSKTAREVVQWSHRLGLDTPIVVENGSAIYALEGVEPPLEPTPLVTLGLPLADILQVLADMPKQYANSFTGFSQLDGAELAELTGLDLEESTAALAREYSEPIVWRKSKRELAEFSSELAARGLQCIAGGRFHHVMGRTDKGRALTWLVERYTHQFEATPTSIALGDSPNDLAMLNAADIAVVVHNPASAELKPSTSRQVYTDADAPQGWAEGINRLVEMGWLAIN